MAVRNLKRVNLLPDPLNAYRILLAEFRQRYRAAFIICQKAIVKVVNAAAYCQGLHLLIQREIMQIVIRKRIRRNLDNAEFLPLPLNRNQLPDGKLAYRHIFAIFVPDISSPGIVIRNFHGIFTIPQR